LRRCYESELPWELLMVLEGRNLVTKKTLLQTTHAVVNKYHPYIYTGIGYMFTWFLETLLNTLLHYADYITIVA